MDSAVLGFDVIGSSYIPKMNLVIVRSRQKISVRINCATLLSVVDFSFIDLFSGFFSRVQKRMPSRSSLLKYKNYQLFWWVDELWKNGILNLSASLANISLNDLNRFCVCVSNGSLEWWRPNPILRLWCQQKCKIILRYNLADYTVSKIPEICTSVGGCSGEEFWCFVYD